jgi:hypothetical protein
MVQRVADAEALVIDGDHKWLVGGAGSLS